VSSIVTMAIALAVVAYLGKTVPPKLSDSLAFNVKVRWLREVQSCDILVLGSSMALNNIDGPELSRLFPGKSVVNAGSWALRLPESRKVFDAMVSKCHPQLVVVPVYYGDFAHAAGESISSKGVDWDRATEYLQGRAEGLRGLLKSDLRYQLQSYQHLRSPEFNSATDYVSLRLDATGGVLFASEGFHVSQARWNGYESESGEVVDAGEYQELDGLLRDIAGNRARAIVVNMPMIAAAQRKFDSPGFRLHWQRVASTTRAAGGTFVDLEDMPLADDQFVDFCHLNESGARTVTRKLVSESGLAGNIPGSNGLVMGSAAR